MAYKIQYYVDNQSEKRRTFCIQTWMAIGLFFCILAFYNYSSEGKEIVDTFLLPEDEKTVTALQMLVTQMEDGTSFFDAMHIFCDFVINGT